MISPPTNNRRAHTTTITTKIVFRNVDEGCEGCEGCETGMRVEGTVVEIAVVGTFETIVGTVVVGSVVGSVVGAAVVGTVVLPIGRVVVTGVDVVGVVGALVREPGHRGSTTGENHPRQGKTVCSTLA
jgi:hypothetical protein